MQSMNESNDNITTEYDISIVKQKYAMYMVEDLQIISKIYTEKIWQFCVECISNSRLILRKKKLNVESFVQMGKNDGCDMIEIIDQLLQLILEIKSLGFTYFRLQKSNIYLDVYHNICADENFTDVTSYSQKKEYTIKNFISLLGSILEETTPNQDISTVLHKLDNIDVETLLFEELILILDYQDYNIKDILDNNKIISELFKINLKEYYYSFYHPVNIELSIFI